MSGAGRGIALVLALSAAAAFGGAWWFSASGAAWSLKPSDFGARKSVQLNLLADGAPLEADWRAAVEWCFVRAASGQRNLAGADLVASGRGQAVLELLGDAVHRVGMDFRPEEISLSALASSSVSKSQNRFERMDKGVATWRRSTSVILRAMDSREPSPIATAKTGQAAEIRPLMDPTVLPPGSDLPLRLYVEGAVVPGVAVRVMAPNGTRRVTPPTDASGITHLRLDQSGVWQLEFLSIQRASEGDKAETFSGTLTFQVGDQKRDGG